MSWIVIAVATLACVATFVVGFKLGCYFLMQGIMRCARGEPAFAYYGKIVEQIAIAYVARQIRR